MHVSRDFWPNIAILCLFLWDIDTEIASFSYNLPTFTLNFLNRSPVNCSQCGNYGNHLSEFFDKNFVKAAVLLKKFLELISRKNISMRENFSFFHIVSSVEKLAKIYFYVKSSEMNSFIYLIFFREFNWHSTYILTLHSFKITVEITLPFFTWNRLLPLQHSVLGRNTINRF